MKRASSRSCFALPTKRLVFSTATAVLTLFVVFATTACGGRPMDLARDHCDRTPVRVSPVGPAGVVVRLVARQARDPQQVTVVAVVIVVLQAL